MIPMLSTIATSLLSGLNLLGVISEPVQLAIIALIGGAITGLIGSVVTPLVLYLIKRQEDANARRIMKEDAEARVAALGVKVDESIVASKEAHTAANGLTGKIADSIKLVETAATLMSNSPQKSDPQLGESAENPVHVTTP